MRADVLVESLRGIVDGMRSVARAVAPALAVRRSWSRGVIEDALSLAFGPVTRGSLEIAVVAGGSLSGAPLDSEWIERVGMRAIARAAGAAARGLTSVADVPIVAARSLERGARVARDDSILVSLLERGARRTDKTLIDFTALAPGLASYADRRERASLSTTQLVGQVVVIRYDPPGFELATARGKVSIGMPARLREKAQSSWGQDVIVLVEAQINDEGDVSDAKALDIFPANGAPAEESFGVLKDKLGAPGALEYINRLRGRS